MPCNPVFQFSKLITAAGRKTTDTRDALDAQQSPQRCEVWQRLACDRSDRGGNRCRGRRDGADLFERLAGFGEIPLMSGCCAGAVAAGFEVSAPLIWPSSASRTAISVRSCVSSCVYAARSAATASANALNWSRSDARSDCAWFCWPADSWL